MAWADARTKTLPGKGQVFGRRRNVGKRTKFELKKGGRSRQANCRRLK